MNIEEAQILNQKIKVLHIDDDELQLINVKNNLEIINKDILIESEKDGLKAIEKISLKNYDIILLDYLMPLYNGIEIANKIRKKSEIPIILYTIQDFEDVNEKIFDSGINDYFKKDINISNYKLLVKKIINVVKKYRIKKIFNKILNNVTDSIVIIDENYKISFYNDNFIKNFKPTDIKGIPILELMDDEYVETFNDFLNNKEEKYIESVILDSNNIRYNIEVNKSVLVINEEYLVLNIKDVTASIIDSEIVHSSDDRFNAIANMSPDAIMTMNMWGYITYMNDSFSRLTGYSEKEIIGKHIIKMPTLEGRDFKPYLDIVKNFLSGKHTSKSFEFPYTRKDGSTGIGDAYIGMIKVNKKRELIAILKDITDKKKNEEEYQNIFKNSPEGIILIDFDGNVKDINSSASNMLNINGIEYFGKNIFNLQREIGQNKIHFKDVYDILINKGSIEPFEIELNFNDNIEYVEISVGLIKVFEDILGIQFILRDVTDQKNIEKERIAYTEKLETLVQERTNQIVDNEKMVTMAKVSSMIAHDLKGPLQVIQNTLYLMQLKPENQEIYLDYIRNAVTQANDLIEEMRIQGKQSPLVLDYVDLSELIDESLIQVKVSENVSFETILKTEKNIRLDKSKFLRVLNNLFKNAIEAMPEGGKITILVEEIGDNVSIKVKDTGVGIPRDKFEKLFRPFQSTKAKGMGLGLAFCKNTVEAHGGNISVESELGKGTTFIISIPNNLENKLNETNNNVINIKDTLMK